MTKTFKPAVSTLLAAGLVFLSPGLPAYQAFAQGVARPVPAGRSLPATPVAGIQLPSKQVLSSPGHALMNSPMSGLYALPAVKVQEAATPMMPPSRIAAVGVAQIQPNAAAPSGPAAAEQASRGNDLKALLAEPRAAALPAEEIARMSPGAAKEAGAAMMDTVLGQRSVAAGEVPLPSAASLILAHDFDLHRVRVVRPDGSAQALTGDVSGVFGEARRRVFIEITSKGARALYAYRDGSLKEISGLDGQRTYAVIRDGERDIIQTYGNGPSSAGAPQYEFYALTGEEAVHVARRSDGGFGPLVDIGTVEDMFRSNPGTPYRVIEVPAGGVLRFEMWRIFGPVPLREIFAWPGHIYLPFGWIQISERQVRREMDPFVDLETPPLSTPYVLSRYDFAIPPDVPVGTRMEIRVKGLEAFGIQITAR